MLFRPYRLMASLSAIALLTGCASRAAHQSSEYGGSIKDTHVSVASKRVAAPTSVVKLSAVKMKAGSPEHPSAVKSDATYEPGPTVQRVITAKTGSDTSAPGADLPTPKAQAPVSTTTSVSVKSSEPTLPPQTPPAPQEARATSDLRRNLGPAPVAAAPVVGKPDSQTVAVSPPKTEVTVTPAAAPIRAPAATTDVGADTTSSKTLNLSGLWLAQNNITNARAALADAVKNQDPALLNALAETYDPITLKRYPRLINEANSARAIELYTQAAAKGSQAAKTSLARLQAFVAKPQ
jgi:hypothetical protein